MLTTFESSFSIAVSNDLGRLSYKIIPPATENLLVDGLPKISLEGHKKVIAVKVKLTKKEM